MLLFTAGRDSPGSSVVYGPFEAMVILIDDNSSGVLRILLSWYVERFVLLVVFEHGFEVPSCAITQGRPCVMLDSARPGHVLQHRGILAWRETIASRMAKTYDSVDSRRAAQNFAPWPEDGSCFKVCLVRSIVMPVIVTVRSGNTIDIAEWYSLHQLCIEGLKPEPHAIAGGRIRSRTASPEEPASMTATVLFASASRAATTRPAFPPPTCAMVDLPQYVTP